MQTKHCCRLRSNLYILPELTLLRIIEFASTDTLLTIP